MLQLYEVNGNDDVITRGENTNLDFDLKPQQNCTNILKLKLSMDYESPVMSSQ